MLLIDLYKSVYIESEVAELVKPLSNKVQYIGGPPICWSSIIGDVLLLGFGRAFHRSNVKK